MVDYVKHFTTETPDSEGRYLVGSNHVVDVCYYDASGESWRRDYTNLVNPFTNPDFTATTVTGSGPNNAGNWWYETGTDTTVINNQRFFKIYKLPFDYADEVLAAKATLIASTPANKGSAQQIIGDYYIDADSFSTPPRNVFPTNYDISIFDASIPYATTSGLATASGVANIGGPAVVAWSLSTVTEVAGFHIDTYDGSPAGISDAQAMGSVMGRWEIQIATSGTGLTDAGYATVASGTNPYGWPHPLWVQITPTPAKYIRLRWRNNGGPRSGLVKFWAYTQDTINRGMSMTVTRVFGSDTVPDGSSRNFQINQTVDLTGINHVYFDHKEGSTTNFSTVQVNGVTKSSFRLANSLGSSATDVYTYRRGYSVDTTSNGAGTQFRIARTMSGVAGSGNLGSGFLSIANFTVKPGWFTETASSKRGSTAAFPERTVIVSDAAGLSIIDSDNMTLWMRFDLGTKKMLQQRPNKILARNGRIYLATSRGLFIIDIPANRCYRLDERGAWQRHGIDYRNENSFDTEEWTAASTLPQRMLHEYMREDIVPILPDFNIVDFAVGTDSSFGNYVIMATSKGLVLYNDAVGASGVYYQSSDRLPVSKVIVSNGSIWYLQGEKEEQVLKYISTISSAARANFSPTNQYYKDVIYRDSLSGFLDRDVWELLKQDPNMSILEGGDALTISGTHTRGGATGIILKGKLPDRDFTAKVKVRILDFPPDARGAVRFGLARDYHPASYLSIESDMGVTTRAGVFVSAFNADSFGWPVFESAPLDSPNFGTDRGLPARILIPGGNSTGKTLKFATPTVAGVQMKSYGSDNSGSNSIFSETLVRISSYPMLARDFTMRADVRLLEGFSATSSTITASNNGAFFGISNHSHMIPGTSGTTFYMSAGMMVGGNTTYSGVYVHTVGKYTTAGQPSAISLTQPKPAVRDPQSTGDVTSPFQEWRFDYEHGAHTLTAFVSGTNAGSIAISDYTNPHNIGYICGMASYGVNATKRLEFKNIRVEYPTLISGSRYKYGMEVTKGPGNLHQVPQFLTASGITMTGNTVPASGTLSRVAGLSDGNLSTGVFSVSQFSSIGVDLFSRKTVEALYLYDSRSNTSGWQNSNSARVGIWYSNDNISWTSYKTMDLNTQERTAGVTYLRFSPAIEARYIKANALDTTANYNLPGSFAWSISEIRAATISGSFFPTDLSEAAEFHEWKIDYSKNTGVVRSYIDNVLVASGTFSGSLKDARLMLLHDLSPVVSGSHSNFCGEFKDLEITFTDPSKLATGEITAVAVNHNQLGSGNSNYTVMTASASGVVVADLDFGLAPTADLVRTFGHSDIFGEIEYVSTIVPEERAHRDTGLVLVGTSTYSPSRYRVRHKKPAWVGNWHDSVDTIYEYGDTFSWGYHVGTSKLLINHDRNDTFFTVVDLETGLCTQISKEHYYTAMGLTTNLGTGSIDSDSLKMVYSAFDDRMWIQGPGVYRIHAIDINTGQTFRPTYSVGFSTALSDGSTITGGRYFIAYSIHNSRIISGQGFITVYDVETYTGVYNPENLVTTPGRWNRAGATPPWTPGLSDDTGTISANYSDYDKCVYFIATGVNGYNTTLYFSKYHVDKNYLETLGTRNEAAAWPTTDASLYTLPFAIVGAQVVSTAYDPKRRRIYVLSMRATKAFLIYWDIVAARWVELGQDPPFTSLREYPSAPSTFNHTNFLLYDNKNDRLLMSNGRGGDEGAAIYELYIDAHQEDPGFDYLPSRDGLPTASGTSKHFTTTSGFISIDTASNFARDFYYSSSMPTTNKAFTYTHTPTMLTISGSTPASIHSNAATHDVLELNISSDTITACRSFDVSAMIALPSFTRDIFASTGTARPAAAHFIMGLRDGLYSPEINTTTFDGQADPGLYQSIEIRAGVSGTFNNGATEFPLVAHLSYVDAFNSSNDAAGSVSTRPQVAYDSYLSGGVNLGSASPTFRHFRLSYDYETDRAEAFVDGVTAGSTTLRRKFNDSTGVRFHMGFLSRTNNDAANAHRWVVQVKDLKVTTKAWDRIERGRLVTSISGATGSYYHEKWDQTLTSGTSWVYYTDMYFPTNRKYSGYDYIASIGGIGDGHKLAELVTYHAADQTKMVGLVGNLDHKHDSSTYLATAEHLWDDIEIGQYKIVKDIDSSTVSVYLGNSSTPAFEVPYASLPAYKLQHVYYGKVKYGAWERIYETTTTSGTWTSNPDYTGASDPTVGKMAFNSNAIFATVAQGLNARATFTLDAGLGTVDVYTFYHATNPDGVRDVPYTITHEGVVLFPDAAAGLPVRSISNTTDELGNFNGSKTTLKIDQRRVRSGSIAGGNKNLSAGSGWIYLGRYINPSSVVITASATANTAQSFVCADAIGIDIGKYGKSTFDMSVQRVRYKTGATGFPADTYEPAGLTIIDLESNTVIDSYGEHTAPSLLDSDITTGTRR